jgi:hypothetical protein
MTKRERILAVCVGGTLAGFALVKGIEYTVVAPLNAIENSITTEQEERDKLNDRLKALKNVEEDWEALTARTLATDPKEAGRRFQKDINELAERHGLRNPKTTPGNPTTSKNNFVSVPLTLRAKGTLKEAIGFLNDFYQRPYIARLDKVTLTSDRGVIESVNSPRRSRSSTRTTTVRGRDRGTTRTTTPSRSRDPVIGPEGPELDISITGVTLVLDELKGLDHPIAPNPIEPGDSRLPRDLAAYNQIFDENLFKPFQPPQVIVKQPTPTEEPEEQEQPVMPTVKVDPRRDAEHFFVTVTTSLNGEPVVYILDDRRRGQPLIRYYLDQEVENEGTLLLIHPRGLVIRTEERGREKDYFYPAGLSFAEREELNRDAHPEIWQAMEAEFLNWDVGGDDGGVG